MIPTVLCGVDVWVLRRAPLSFHQRLIVSVFTDRERVSETTRIVVVSVKRCQLFSTALHTELALSPNGGKQGGGDTVLKEPLQVTVTGRTAGVPCAFVTLLCVNKRFFIKPCCSLTTVPIVNHLVVIVN